MTRAWLAVLLFAAQDGGVDPKRQFEERRAALKECVQADPWAELGDWALDRKLEDQAKKSFLEALRLDPRHVRARDGMRRLRFEEQNGKWQPFAAIFGAKRSKVKAGDKEGLFELAAWCKSHDMPKEWRACLDSILKLDPEDARANEAIGRRRWNGEWLEADAYQKEIKVEEILRAGIAANRSAADLSSEIQKAVGAWSGDTAAIMARAKNPGPGTYKDQKLQVEADKFPGVFHYGIPEGYVPWRKTPMIVFLHGSGGNTYFPTISKWTLNRGFIIVCPSSLHLGTLAWSNGQHVGYLRALVKEMKQRYCVDPDRIYLWGHSMGGYGTFFLGTRLTDTFAAISPMSGGPSGWSPQALKNTPIYIWHGAADQQVPPDGSRSAAKWLKDQGYAHVYEEVPGQGHDMTADCLRAIPEWFLKHKLSPQARTAAK